MKKIILFLFMCSFIHIYANNNNSEHHYLNAEQSFNLGNYDEAYNCLLLYIRYNGISDKIEELKNKIDSCKILLDTLEVLSKSNDYVNILNNYKKLQTINPQHPNIATKLIECQKMIEKEQTNINQSIELIENSTIEVTVPINKFSSKVHNNLNNRVMKSETFTFDIGVTAGTNLGVSLDFSASYFLFGCGINWIMITPEQVKKSYLVNSGYVGNFTKTTTIKLEGACVNPYLNLGGYFKYFSFSCQIGILCGSIINEESVYNGSGYGIVDGDVHEYWGIYQNKDIQISKLNDELHLTLTPQIKGYIPMGIRKNIGLSLGVGYTIIPILEYCIGLSGYLGLHCRF